MTNRTIRQATLAYLRRVPASEWTTYGDIGDVILGRPYEKGDYYKAGRDEAGDRKPGPRTQIGEEIERMRLEGLVEYASHLGIRLKR